MWFVLVAKCIVIKSNRALTVSLQSCSDTLKHTTHSIRKLFCLFATKSLRQSFIIREKLKFWLHRID
jgi:hypothetical protein